GVDMADDRHRDDPIAFLQGNSPYANRVAARKDTHTINGEAYALSKRCRQEDIVAIGARLDREDLIALVIEFHCNLAVTVDLDEIRQLVASNRPTCGGKHHVQIIP